MGLIMGLAARMLVRRKSNVVMFVFFSGAWKICVLRYCELDMILNHVFKILINHKESLIELLTGINKAQRATVLCV